MRSSNLSRKTILLLCLVLLVAGNLSGKELTQAEIDYKADFIIKVMDYVTWPEGKDTDSEGTVIIGVIGESQLTPKLEELAAKKTDEGIKTTIEIKSLEDDLNDCQIVFLPTKNKTNLAKILKKAQNSPVLTISDCDYFGRYGVMINFYKESNKKAKIKFEVNTMTLKFVGLKMSSKLLKLATII